MAFKSNFSRREQGGYDAKYGKGAKQLTAVIEQSRGTWSVTNGHAMGLIPASKKISDVKAGWAASAEAAYGTAGTEFPDPSPTPPRIGPPSLRKAVGGGVISGSAPQPPSLGLRLPKPDKFPVGDLAPEGAATCPHCSMPFTGWTWAPGGGEHKRYIPPCRCNSPNPVDYMPDPLDYRMYDTSESGKRDKLTETGALDVAYHWMLRNREYCLSDGILDAPWRQIQETLWRVTGYAEYRPEVWNGETQ